MYSFKNHLGILKTFFVIGLTSFGGYMALIAMIRRNMVERDNVITDEFLTEGITLSSFLPGPVAVNVVAYVGYKLAGVTGALLSIIAVLLPSFLLVTVCSVLYFNYGEAYSFDLILIGIVPAVIGIILSVGLSMAKKICIHWTHFLIAVGGFTVLFIFSGYWIIVITLLVAGISGLIIYPIEIVSIESQKRKTSTLLVWLIVVFGLLFLAIKLVFPEQILSKLFVEFSGVSITLFGGGYVMIPTLKTILVDQLAWINYEEFVFGISIGQVTPGPILISAAFFGYKMAGITGALISSIAIFLPSSLLMIGASEIYQNVRSSRMLQAALSGIKPAVVGLIFYSGVSLFIKQIEIHQIWIPSAILAASFIAINRLKTSTAVVILASGVIGLILSLI